MLLRLIFWLFHRHEWLDFKTDQLSNGTAVVGNMYLQKCSHRYCQKYRSQKIMSIPTLPDYSR